MSDFVGKRAFLVGEACRTGGWYAQHTPEELYGPGLKWRFYAGADVGRRYQASVGSGRSLPRTPLDSALAKTEKAVKEGADDLLFEASFAWGRLVARADALRRSPGGWTVLEVKSGLSPKNGRVREDYVDDLAYTVCVTREAGVPVTGAALVLINRDYRLGGDAPMLEEVDVSDAALSRAAAFSESAQDIAHAISAEERPEPSLSLACKHCGHFEAECIGKDVSDPLFLLPRLSEKKFAELREYERVSQLPSTASLTATQQRVADIVRSGTEHVDAKALHVLDDITWPAHYLDFEAVSPYLPWFPDRPPYDAVPFQYSVHIRREHGAEPEHREYLASPTEDWRRELAERLLADLGTKGSIVAYSSYEKTRIRALGELFPDLAKPLDALVARLFDLERVFKDGYQHPGFVGRTSIKKVLPVVVPELTYDGLEVSSGDDAAGTFALMRVGEYPPDTHAAHREHLLKYCALDTRAMLELHEAMLVRLAAYQ